MALDQQRRRFPAELPSGLGRDRAGVERIEIAPGRQHLGPAAARRAGGTGQHQTAVEPGEQPRQLGGAALRHHRAQLLLDPGEDGAGALPARLGRNLAGDEAQRQRLQALDRVAGIAPPPRTGEHRRTRPPPRLGQVKSQRILAEIEIGGQGAQQRGVLGGRATAGPGKGDQQGVEPLGLRDFGRTHAARRGSATP